ncbi:hypothetical protein [Cyanobium sp. ATX 6A2]|uniref:hypothetical protein n=1 Tax=Cyanobium sp. ATX 6A2 TaxID=2823700 RepID=UPI0020CCD55B|nr:hypothetical protein [Cyanobium sp. ATX 6A2]
MSQAAAPGVVQTVPIDVDVVIALDRLPDAFHGDPADRLIVATGSAAVPYFRSGTVPADTEGPNRCGHHG